jgi:hypothetical protein
MMGVEMLKLIAKRVFKQQPLHEDSRPHFVAQASRPIDLRYVSGLDSGEIESALRIAACKCVVRNSVGGHQFKVKIAVDVERAQAVVFLKLIEKVNISAFSMMTVASSLRDLAPRLGLEVIQTHWIFGQQYFVGEPDIEDVCPVGLVDSGIAPLGLMETTEKRRLGRRLQ